MTYANAVDNHIFGIQTSGYSMPTGCVGEIISASNTGGTSPTSGANFNIMSLTTTLAGYWEMWGNFYVLAQSGISNAYAWISTTSATYPSNTTVTCIPGANTPVAAGPAPMWTSYLPANTIVYLSGQGNFNGTATFYGNIFVKRYM